MRLNTRSLQRSSSCWDSGGWDFRTFLAPKHTPPSPHHGFPITDPDDDAGSSVEVVGGLSASVKGVHVDFIWVLSKSASVWVAN